MAQHTDRVICVFSMFRLQFFHAPERERESQSQNNLSTVKEKKEEKNPKWNEMKLYVRNVMREATKEQTRRGTKPYHFTLLFLVFLMRMYGRSLSFSGLMNIFIY